ncbi:MAG: type II and III secretion system protein [Spirulinaceae cyanobacterium RM2_2_10]|nr:type II and III secretion system protein [Spirulinaceae cyanobacterium RM2_2_10]
MGAPLGQIFPSDASQMILAFAPSGSASPVPPSEFATGVQPAPAAPTVSPLPASPVPDELSLVPAEDFQTEDFPALPDPQGAAPTQSLPTALPTSTPSAPVAQPSPQPFTLDTSPLAQRSDVLVPNPEITIDGQPAPLAQPAQPLTPAPPLLPRAVPPPVGDIAVANLNVAPAFIDLGTAARVPRIVLQDAPVRDVLALLARSADLNLIFADAPAAGDAGAPSGFGPTISLDLENEPVQDVFNYVIQASNLQAARRGRTVFVGINLPQSARDVATRTFRLNQVEAEFAATYLASLGAETQLVLLDQQEDIVNPQTQEVIGRRPLPPTLSRITADREEAGGLAGNYVLDGLTIATDDRLNSVTMIGEPVKVQMATTLLTQLDARRRQVAVNVKIIDVNLQNLGRFSTSFSFGINNTGVLNQSGLGIINFGTSEANFRNEAFIFDVDAAPVDADGNPVPPQDGEGTPASTALGFDGIGAIAGQPVSRNFEIVNAFLAQLQFSIQNNNAKILTDPTLVIQEGSSAGVNLVEEVVGDVEITTTASGGTITTEVDVEKQEVGLQLGIDVQRVDDNGFITMAVNPTVSSIGGTQVIASGGGNNTITLVNSRRLTSGTVRLRDGQTLILSGVIQDIDRVNVQKIPILGDLPIIGALFRRTARDNERAEVIIMVTPRVLDDSQFSNFGYTYTPGSDAQRMLQQQGFPFPQQ